MAWLQPQASFAQAPSEPRFAVLEYQVEGNTVLAVAPIEAALTPFLGPGRTVADVEKARAALERTYQGAGFLSVFVDIPEQQVDAGIVRLRVIEGRVERLAVTGARYHDQGWIRARVDEIAEGRVPNFNTLQQQVAAVSRGTRQLQPVLRPGRTPGTVQAELKVNDRLPLEASVELNNQHAADTDAWRLQASLRYDNLFQREHSLSLTAITAPRKTTQSQVLVANYSLPLAADWTGLAYVVASDSLVEPVGASVVGKGFTLGLRAVHSLALPASSHSLALGADFKDLKEKLEFGDGSLSTPLRYLPFQLAYSGQWPEGRRISSLNMQLVWAWRSLLQRDVDCPGTLGRVDQFACKRSGGDGSFTYWRGEWRHQRPLSLQDDADAARSADAGAGLPGQISLRLGWQLAAQPLVSAEQYAVGGADTVRGYLEASASGDRGLLASAEWRSPDLWPATASVQGGADGLAVQELSARLFVDGARIWVEQPTVGQAARASLLGAGLGLRLRGRHWAAELDLAQPRRQLPGMAGLDPRLHLKLRAQY